MTQTAFPLRTVVADAVIHLLYLSRRLPWASEPEWTLRSLGRADHLFAGGQTDPNGRCSPWLPEAWRPALADRYDDQIWRRDPDIVLSPDLSEPVGALVGHAGSSSVRAYRPAEWGNRLCRLLDGRGLWPEGQRPDGRRNLVLVFGARAKARLAAAGWEGSALRLTIEESRLFQFRSDQALLDLPVRIAPVDRAASITAAVLAEATHALSRFNSLCWQGPDGVASASFTMGDIARSLMEGPHGETRGDWRTYSVTFARLEPSARDEDAAWLGVALAKHYTPDYAFRASEDVAIERLSAFEGIHRCAAQEGAAVVVAPGGQSVDFLKEYEKTAFTPAYLPLAILALHEAVAWRALFDQSKAWFDLEDRRADALATLRKIRTSATQLRLAFDLSAVSAVGDHERWKEALDRGHRLPALRRALFDEVAAIEALLDADHRRAVIEAEALKQSRTAWIAIVATFFASWVTAFSLLKDVLAPTLKDFVWAIGAAELSPPATIAALVGTVAGAVAAGLAYWRLIYRLK